MGSRFVYRDEAMKILGVSIRTLDRYSRRGLIKTKFEGRRILFLEDDLLQLKKGRWDLVNSPLTKEAFSKLQAEVQTLKTQVATIMRILNVSQEPLRFSLVEYQNFYVSAKQFATEGWPPHVEEMWAENFLRLRMEDLEQISSIVNDPHPWRPFLQLANTMYAAPQNKNLHDLLGAGCTHLNQLVGIWSASREESLRNIKVLIERDATPSKRMLRKLNKASRLAEGSSIEKSTEIEG